MIIKKRVRKLFFRIFVYLLYTVSVVGCATGTSSRYLIAAPIEIDSILSAWLIRTHIDTKATFAMVDVPVHQPAGLPASGKLISALYPQASGATQFEQILVTAHVSSDPCIDRLKEASRVLEVMAWRKSQFPAVLELEAELKITISEKTDSQDQDMDKAFVVIDRWCKEQNKI